MGSELSIQSCVSDCTSDPTPPKVEDDDDLLMVQLSQPFGMTLCSEQWDENIVKTVSECEADGNAAAAGVVDGMILLKINGVDMRRIDLDTLGQFIRSLPPNKTISLTFLSRDNCDPRGVPLNQTKDVADVTKTPDRAQSTPCPDDRSNSKATESVEKEKEQASVLAPQPQPKPEQDSSPVAINNAVGSTNSNPCQEELLQQKVNMTVTDKEAISDNVRKVKSTTSDLSVNITEVKAASVRKHTSANISPSDRQKDIVAAALKKLDLKEEIEAGDRAAALRKNGEVANAETREVVRLSTEVGGGQHKHTDTEKNTEGVSALSVPQTHDLRVHQAREGAQLKVNRSDAVQLEKQVNLQAERSSPNSREDADELAQVTSELATSRSISLVSTADGTIDSHSNTITVQDNEQTETVNTPHISPGQDPVRELKTIGVDDLAQVTSELATSRSIAPESTADGTIQSHSNTITVQDNEQTETANITHTDSVEEMQTGDQQQQQQEELDTPQERVTQDSGEKDATTKKTALGADRTLSLSAAISPSCLEVFSSNEQDVINKCVSLLRRGVEVKKHNRLVAPSSKWLHVDPQLQKIYWRNEVDNAGPLKKSKSQRKLFGKSDAEREVLLSDILEVRNSCSSDVLKRSKSKKKLSGAKDESCHVLCLVLKDRTLNFEMKEGHWDVLYSALGLVVGFLKQQQQQQQGTDDI